MAEKACKEAHVLRKIQSNRWLIKGAVRAVRRVKVVSPSIEDVWDSPLREGLVRTYGLSSCYFPGSCSVAGRAGQGKW